MTAVATDPSGVIAVGGRQEMLAPQEVQRMVALKAPGWGTMRISKELGCCRNSIRKYLRTVPRIVAPMRYADLRFLVLPQSAITFSHSQIVLYVISLAHPVSQQSCMV
ncbi:hypothetical protein KAK11_21240 [Ideonella paludis]|uniref:Uncharacterized protein n=1 Tax=Ideonella paludis TaxID=1233411 RepID=A0ABS5E3B0_9BURK|nr:hypothetical protein [Ideonella paludis]